MSKHSATAKHSSLEIAASPASPSKVGKSAAITAEQRQQMIAEAAYFLAERRGFNGGDPGQDWLEAEAEIERRLKGAPPH